MINSLDLDYPNSDKDNKISNINVRNTSERSIKVYLTQFNSSYLSDDNFQNLNDECSNEWEIKHGQPYFLCIKDCEILHGFIVYGEGIYKYNKKGHLLKENSVEHYDFKEKITNHKKIDKSIGFYAAFEDATFNWKLLDRKTSIEKENYASEKLSENEITLISLDSEENNVYPVFCGKFYIIIKNSIIIDAETNVIVRALPEAINLQSFN